MYIEPLTLFIIGEFLVVYIIINIFLFYKGRLFNVLSALLKEMRLKKLQEGQRQQDEIASLQSSNKGLVQKIQAIEASAKNAGKPIFEQLQERTQALSNIHPRSHDLDSSIEFDESNQWLRMRMLELETQVLSGDINESTWQELANEAIVNLSQATLNAQQKRLNKKDNAESERMIGELEHDLAGATRQLDEAKRMIKHLKSELENAKAINTPTDNIIGSPVAGANADELYRLKCDNFDLHEAINKLKLELLSGEDLSAESLNDLLESQIANMEQYIASADISIGLHEKELQAANDKIASLTAQSSTKPKDVQSQQVKGLSELSANNSEQSEALGTIRESIIQLKNNENTDAAIQDLEAEILRLESLFNESEQCIILMESALDASTDKVTQLEEQLAQQEALKSKVGGLNDTQQSQKEGLGNIKNIMDQIRDGGDEQVLTKLHDEELKKMEGFLKESETIIQQLETELDELNERLENGQTAPASESAPEQSENLLEMEGLLQQSISDIQSLSKNIAALEAENESLKNQLRDMPSPIPI